MTFRQVGESGDGGRGRCGRGSWSYRGEGTERGRDREEGGGEVGPGAGTHPGPHGFAF